MGLLGLRTKNELPQDGTSKKTIAVEAGQVRPK